MAIELFSSDIDHTLLGKPDATQVFAQTWNSLIPDKKPLLVYNTGRTLDSAQSIVKQTGLPLPDFFICGVGTQIFDVGQNQNLEDYQTNLNQNWDRARVDEIVRTIPQIDPQPDKFQTKYKSSWFLYHATLQDINALRKNLKSQGLQAEIIYSSSRDLDILPKHANKGHALEWLLRHLNIHPSSTLVAGDSGNDLAMFGIENVKGILVENSDPHLLRLLSERIYLSNYVCAEGVLDGLQHFKVVDKIFTAQMQNITNDQFAPEITQLVRGEETPISDEDKSLLKEGYSKALEVIHKNCTPLGFSACDIHSNEYSGTDENYFSVWTRDSCITLIGTLGCDSEIIANCQSQTLETILQHLSPNGQVPSYVQIKTGHAEYSGLGGISSVDSNLWFIIAFYEYIKHTGDIKLLRRSLGKLRMAMNWLSGLDSNNDDLLEIPETGDWADLFGFSYHVLYDEVLWFRANMCFGWLLERMNGYQEAASVFEKAGKIKEVILAKFWPSTRQNPSNFADSQFYLGDVKYLLSEVSPFKYNWRCDVYGNILASLFNILDPGRTKTVFRFLWGVGVNDPYPVKNLYPTVHSGAHDWKDYFVVNSQNLPHHYHNGGIWPFIGGFWVQYINQMGLYDVACKELVKLARLNQLGTFKDWEFNEWSHGETGRPMGKAYQAWSAASYILAFHELGLNKMMT